MAGYLLQRELWVPQPIERVFEFFADARNLEAITPSWLGFRIVTPGPIAMGAGALIEYRIRWHGLPGRWLTEIRSWDPPGGFADVQLRGPYRLWEHAHRFQTVDGGTLISDVVHYALPFGPLGRLVHAGFVKAELEEIFDYRAAKVAALLGTTPNHA